MILFIGLAFWSCKEDLPEDCAGVAGGIATVDSCGICDDDLSNDCITDCEGVWGGITAVDSCGICDDDVNNDCVQDCMGEWGGTVQLNNCGHCQDNFDCNFSGYMDKISYFPGEIAELYINSNDSIFSSNLGIYDIDGMLINNIITSISPQSIANENPWENGFGYQKTTDFQIPYLNSGIYFIAQDFTDNIYLDKIFFIVKTISNVDAIIIYPSNTGNAYNAFGGRSLYTNPGAQTVSFLRPQHLRHFAIPFLQWASNTTYNFGYICDYDVDDHNNLSNSDIIIIPGHSEYWTRSARENFDNFINSGKDAIILSGNNMWWQVRYQDNGNKMVCYKNDSDPIGNTLLETINWFEPSLEYPIIESLGADYFHGGYGLYNDFGWDGYKIVKPESPLFAGCDFTFNEILSMPHVEIDSVPISEFLEDGTPIIDNYNLGFYKIELLAYDQVARYDDESLSHGTFIALQKTETTGIIINTATTNWCKEGFNGIDNEKVEIITRNMIDLLMEEQSVFTE